MASKTLRKLLIVCRIFFVHSIHVYSFQTTFRSGFDVQCAKWNVSAKELLFGQSNKSAGNDERSLNLSASSLALDPETGSIAVLDDNNGRILVFNRSNSSSIFNIVLNSSNSTNTGPVRYRPLSLAYSSNASLYISYGWTRQIFRLSNPLEAGMDVTVLSIQDPYGTGIFSDVAGGLCIDTFDESIYIINNNQIFRSEFGSQTATIYVSNNIAGQVNYQLNQPTSIVMGSDGTLFVNDVGNHRIQMFKWNSTNGTTLSANVNDSVALSFYPPDILIITTRTAIYLFNLTDNITMCAIGCQSSELSHAYNAVIDWDGNLIVSESNTVLLYPMERQCPDVTTQSTISMIGFNPTENCSSGWFGTNCPYSKDICQINGSCLNSGRCISNQSVALGFHCECPAGFDGVHCQNDRRLCKPTTCFGRGNCSNNSRGEAECRCESGYQGQWCEKIIKICDNIICENRGVCFEQQSVYTCQCLAGFYGRHCESMESNAVIRGYVTKSFGYVAVLMLVGVISFVVIMDVLKYVLNIDPVRSQRTRLREKRMAKARKKPTIGVRFQYVN